MKTARISKFTAEDYEKVERELPEDNGNKILEKEPLFEDKELVELEKALDQPINSQKNMAARLKIFLDRRIEEEIKNKGILSDHTRRWVETYNALLNNLHKNLHGEKSVNLHLGKISHAHIGSMMREMDAEVLDADYDTAQEDNQQSDGRDAEEDESEVRGVGSGVKGKVAGKQSSE